MSDHQKIVHTVLASTSVVIAQTMPAASSLFVVDCFVAENAQLTYALTLIGHAVSVNVQLRFYLEQSATVAVELLCAHSSGSIVVEATLRGEGAHIVVGGAYILDASHALEVCTLQHHRAAHTQSNLIMRGILRDNSIVTYRGMIRVDKNARSSVSSQENKNIITTDTARALSIPSLEVFTNDVRCFHASAIGRFDQDQLLYAASRGIGEKEAQRLFLHAFFANMFKNEVMKNHLMQLL